jgi:hypothetical protein
MLNMGKLKILRNVSCASSSTMKPFSIEAEKAMRTCLICGTALVGTITN